MDFKRLLTRLFQLGNGDAVYLETVHESITTTNATPTA